MQFNVIHHIYPPVSQITQIFKTTLASRNGRSTPTPLFLLHRRNLCNLWINHRFLPQTSCHFSTHGTGGIASENVDPLSQSRRPIRLWPTYRFATNPPSSAMDQLDLPPSHRHFDFCPMR